MSFGIEGNAILSIGPAPPEDVPFLARPTVQPGSLLEHAEPWPPGYNGLYDWWVTLEIRGGAPVLYLYANQIAG